MPRKITPPKHRGQDAVGQLPKVAPSSAADPPPLRRCSVCRRMMPDCVRQLHPPEPARFTCHSCLEAAGQIPLLLLA